MDTEEAEQRALSLPGEPREPKSAQMSPVLVLVFFSVRPPHRPRARALRSARNGSRFSRFVFLDALVTSQRLLCCPRLQAMSFLIYLDRGCIASNGVNGSPRTVDDPNGSGLQVTRGTRAELGTSVGVLCSPVPHALTRPEPLRGVEQQVLMNDV